MDRSGAAPSSDSQVVIHGGRMYWPDREIAPSGTASGMALDEPSRIEQVRNTFVLLVVCGYLLFNWGFMQIRIPPVAGGGIPIGEITIFLFLITLNYTGVLGRLSQTVYVLPFLIWWTFGVGRAMFDFMNHGVWALRDAAHVLESLFIIIGFAFAAHPKNLERFFVWLPRLLFIAVCYGMLYPLRLDFASFSPTITTGAGGQAPIIGTMTNTPYMLLMAAAYLLLFQGHRLLGNLGAVALIGFTVAMFQARTIYLMVLAVFAFMILYRRSTIGNLGVLVYLAGLLLALIPLLDLQIQGRLGETFSFDFLVQHFLAIFGISSSEYQGVSSAAAGVDQRLDWWQSIFDKMWADPFKLLLGLGYGIPLTDFHGAGGAIVREPHNSYISVIARTGVVGAICWVLMMLILVRRWHRTFMDCRALDWRVGENRLMILMVFQILIWILAIGEDGFEKPYNIVPFYFFWGIILRFSYLLDQGMIGPEAEQIESAEEAYEPPPPSWTSRTMPS